MRVAFDRSAPDLSSAVAARLRRAREQSVKSVVVLRNEQYISAIQTAAHTKGIDFNTVATLFGIQVQFVAEFANLSRDEIRELAAHSPLLFGIRMPIESIRQYLESMRAAPSVPPVVPGTDENSLALASLRISQINYEYLLTIATAVDRAASSAQGYRQCALVLNCPPAVAELIHQTGWDILQSLSKLGTSLVGWRPCGQNFRRHLDLFRHTQDCSMTRVALLIDAAHQHRGNS